ncbi:N-acetylmuramoyl-L-alanine amidase [Dokdonella soli]
MPALAIDNWPLPYEERLAERPSAAIDLVVIHCTELPDMQMAREFGERIHYAGTQTGNSGHYYIDLTGKVFRFVADTRVANHTFGYNPRSIGIELVNIGRYPHWGDSRHQAFTVPYTHEQIDSLRALLAQLRNDHANLHWIAGHEDLDRRLEPAIDDPAKLLPRRLDPGPLFPWAEVIDGSGLERLSPPASEHSH